VYGASPDLLRDLGAINPTSWQVAPTLYVVGRDDTVRWNDSAARYHHADVAATVQELQRAIDAALAAR